MASGSGTASYRGHSPREQQAIVAAAARKAGINPAVLWGLYGAETNFGNNVRTSGAGALGPFQFMPGTAKSYGIDPNNFRQAAFAAAKYLATYKSRGTRGMLAAYNAGPAGNPNNPETRAYVPKVLELAKTYRGGGGGAGMGASGSRTASVGALDAQGAAQGSTGTLALLQALTSNEKQAPPITAPAAPAFAAGPTMPQGYQAPQSMSAPQAPKPDVNALLTAIQTQGQGTGVPGNPAASVTTRTGASSGGNAHALTRVKGTANFEGHKVAAWIAPVLSYARKQGWKGQVNSGFRSLADQTRIYNSGVRPAARPGTSNHEGAQYPRGAVDVSNAQQLSDIIKRSRYSHLLQWAGAKDPVHFSHPHNGSY